MYQNDIENIPVQYTNSLPQPQVIGKFQVSKTSQTYIVYATMVIVSIIKFTIVFPVPVTAFNHTAENDIINKATETTRMTGMASEMKD